MTSWDSSRQPNPRSALMAANWPENDMEKIVTSKDIMAQTGRTEASIRYQRKKLGVGLLVGDMYLFTPAEAKRIIAEINKARPQYDWANRTKKANRRAK